MTILKTNQTNKADPFKQATELWDLERLYADLETVNGEELTNTEKLHLRGLLCGYNSSTLADKLHRSYGGLRSEVSKHVNRHVKDLVNQSSLRPKKKLEKLNSGEILKWLEELGYKKSGTVSSDGLIIQIDAATGSVIKVVNKLGKKNKGRVTFEISNSRVLFSLPTEEFPKLLAQLEKDEDGEKEEE
jgi:hypothetical protein